MAAQGIPDRSPRRAETACPTCGAAAERGQLVCLECGGRIALAYRRPPSWKVPVAIAAAVAVLAVVGAVIAYEAIDDEAQREVAALPVKVKKPSSGGGQAAGRKPATEAKAPAKAKPERPVAATGGLVRKGAVYAWPRSLRAFTVVLLSAQDRRSATGFARTAAGTRAAKVGVIRSNDFASLPKGFFVVFAGEYENRTLAEKAAARLGKRFSGAFPQLVKK